ncbi:hypothetical protein BBJ28_00000947 [Nothophytophthora sp. Chile5]|nr:hypothetical protein BBJ28_00000947 [Nothophytophthora sp. Chile5]
MADTYCQVSGSFESAPLDTTTKMKEPSAPSVVDVQHQIRANASQLQDYFSDLYSWEKAINKDDVARQRAPKSATQAVPPPRAAQVVAVRGNGSADVKFSTDQAKKPDAHTYDKGYKRWDQFDVVSSATSKSSKSREELEREDGNAHYKRGDYVAAIKSYTRCLGYNPQNAVVLSNRAMAFLKNREFANAEDDCTLALKADPTHVKSYSRRGTARNSLGKHRLALLDFQRAAALDPKSRQVQTQLQSTRELIRMAIKRAPSRTNCSIEVVGEPPTVKQPGPEQEEDGNDNKENLASQPMKGPSTGHVLTEKESSPRAVADSSPAEQASAIPPPPQMKAQKKSSTAILLKLPKKAPASSYEFGRVWKSLAMRGDSGQQKRLLGLRADYLRMIDPHKVGTIFKTAIESDVLCEIFHVFRHALLSPVASGTSGVEGDVTFVREFASELTKVPRFNMTVMFLSASEKEDMTWVIERLRLLLKEGDEAQTRTVADLKKLYELP